MAKNDIVILNSLIDDRVASLAPSSKRDEVFEFFAAEQILKDLNLSTEQISKCSVDGRNDGGIDYVLILINGNLLVEENDDYLPKSNVEMEVYLITCKHHDTFRQATLDALIASLTELFNLSIEDDNLSGDYNEKVLAFRNLLKSTYRKLSSKISSFNTKIFYASRGDTGEIGEAVIARSEQLIKITENSFRNSNTVFLFNGSSELLDLYRKVPNFSLELPFTKIIDKGDQYVLLTELKSYNKLIVDEYGNLRRYLFNSNVRAFLGFNRVNEDIRNTLLNTKSPDFWWLNNGVTILATNARDVGNAIFIEDIQIVNGLQTTESIYNYFKNGGQDANSRSILVKILKSNDKLVRDEIIRATNNQTNVEISSLHATDKIQKDIEDILLRNGFFYERRSNFYKGKGISETLLLTPIELAAGYMALILKNPVRSTILKSKFMQFPEQYEKIFSIKKPLEIWPNIAAIFKKTDMVLEEIRKSENIRVERFLRKWRYITAYITVSRLIGKFNYSKWDLIKFDAAFYQHAEIITTWNFFKNCTELNLDGGKRIMSGEILGIYLAASKEFNISGFEIFIKEK